MASVLWGGASAWFVPCGDGQGIGISADGVVWIGTETDGSIVCPGLAGAEELAFIFGHLARTERLPEHVYVGENAEVLGG